MSDEPTAAPRPALREQIEQAVSHYFNAGRCSGHDQFNGRYCRDVATSERWCIHCAGFMLLTALRADEETRMRLAQENQLAWNTCESAETRARHAEAEVARLTAALEERTQERDEAKREATDWLLVADGVKHDWRCFNGEAGTDLCLRCQTERLTAALVTAERELHELKRAIAPSMAGPSPWEGMPETEHFANIARRSREREPKIHPAAEADARTPEDK